MNKVLVGDHEVFNKTVVITLGEVTSCEDTPPPEVNGTVVNEVVTDNVLFVDGVEVKGALVYIRDGIATVQRPS